MWVVSDIPRALNNKDLQAHDFFFYVLICPTAHFAGTVRGEP